MIGKVAPAERGLLHRAEPQHRIKALVHRIDEAVGHDELDRDGRVCRQELGDDRRQPGCAEADRGADPQEAARLPGTNLPHGVRRVGLREDDAAPLVIALPQLG